MSYPAPPIQPSRRPPGKHCADSNEARNLRPHDESDVGSEGERRVGEAQCIELGGNMAVAGGYIYVQPTANVTNTNLAAGDVIEMVSAVELAGASRGILGWEAELTITKPVGGASTTFYFRSMDKYQEPFTMPASFSGQLETQRGTVDLTETVITSRMGLYLAAGVPQNSIVKVSQFGIRKV
nr:hypothetical protein [Pseudomonas coronafaciens]